jgi:hypothetical protein
MAVAQALKTVTAAKLNVCSSSDPNEQFQI